MEDKEAQLAGKSSAALCAGADSAVVQADNAPTKIAMQTEYLAKKSISTVYGAASNKVGNYSVLIMPQSFTNVVTASANLAMHAPSFAYALNDGHPETQVFR